MKAWICVCASAEKALVSRVFAAVFFMAARVLIKGHGFCRR